MPATIDAVAGVTVMPVRLGPVTVRTLLPVMLNKVAVIVALPAATPLASAPGVIVAAAGLLLDQVTLFVQSLLAEFTFGSPMMTIVQVAVNCCVFPAVVEAVEGVTWMPPRLTPGLTAVESKVAVTVQLAAGMVPEYVVVPVPPHPITLVRVAPLFAVTVHE